MKKPWLLLAALLALPGLCQAQVGGSGGSNIGYSRSGAKAQAEQRERAKRVVAAVEKPTSGTSMFVEADVLMNVKADEHVAVFGISQEGASPEECGRKMDAVVKELTDRLKGMGIAEDDLFVDFIVQTKIYGFEISGDLAREKLVGFELKKNLSVHYKDRSLVDKLVVAAAESKVYDLIKVDYVIRDIEAVHEKLMAEAARIIKRKTARYEQLLGIKLIPPAQVFAERTAEHYPTEMYDAFTAAETEEIAVPDRQKYTVQGARKSRTVVFNGLDSDGFDAVINPVILEPVVQCTLYLKVKYEVEPVKAR